MCTILTMHGQYSTVIFMQNLINQHFVNDEIFAERRRFIIIINISWK